MWVVENNRLTNTKFTDEEFTGNPVLSPYPKVLWRLEDKLTHDFLPAETPKNSVEKPYPKTLWRIENNKLTHEFLNKYLGAFECAEKLGKVIIPESVKKIGGQSFQGTILKSVKIAQDCSYFESSFPKNCEVNFYPNEEV